MPAAPITQTEQDRREQDRREQDRDCAKCLLPQPRAPHALVVCAIVVVAARITLKYLVYRKVYYGERKDLPPPPNP